MSLLVSRRLLIQAAAIGPFGIPALAAPARGFTHSVASGDPQQRSVVLWTRFVGADGGEARLKAEVADDPRFARIVARGEALAGPLGDFCAHARPDGLKPGRWYYYRFVAPDGTISPVGRTRTLPEGALDRFRIGVFSCANATSGWFTAYAHAAARDDLDLLVHTGDYIYESPVDRSDALAALAVERDIQPRHEAVALADYRLRYASYRRDPALMELHRRFPMIVMWDDHEVANNSWAGGAKNHDETSEGPWAARKAAGLQAFREWLPTGRADYERYQIGGLATLFRLETRFLARTEQLDIRSALAGAAAFRDGPLADPARTMMGRTQEQWLFDGLAQSVRSGTPWQLVAQQVIMAPTRLPPVSSAWYAPGVRPAAKEQAELAAAEMLQKAGVPTMLDRWDGYPAARHRLFESARQADADLVVLSGDSHTAWAFDLEHDGKPIGVELAGQSVSSLGLEKRFGGDPRLIAAAFQARNPLLKWCDTSRRGYMTIEITRNSIESQWLFLIARDSKSTAILDTHTAVVERGARALSKA
jgi:alkaline phosphatase D